MKISNKILLAGFTFLALLFISGLVYSRQYITELPIDERGIEATGNYKEKMLSPTLLSDTLRMGTNYTYILNSNFDGVKIKGDESVMEEYEINLERGLDIYQKSKRRISRNNRPVFEFGVKNIDSLTIISKKYAILKTANQTNIPYINIQTKKSTNIKINNIGEHIKINCRDRSTITVKGQVKQLEIYGRNNGFVETLDLKSDVTEIYLEDNATWRVNQTNNITGVIEDNSSIQSRQEIDVKNVKMFDKSKQYIESWD